MGDVGLYAKYIITKADGTPVNDRCFVLKPDKDPAAAKALQAYAAATDNEQLRNNLYAWVGKPTLKPMALEEFWKEDDLMWVEHKNGALYIGDFYVSMSAKNGWDVQTLGSAKPRLLLRTITAKHGAAGSATPRKRKGARRDGKSKNAFCR